MTNSIDCNPDTPGGTAAFQSAEQAGPGGLG
jgi:hypothetical protein